MQCNICPRKCNIDRSKHAGYCGMTDTVKIARAELHFWEEPCISGDRGSGTVFFSGCPLKCVYCQNNDISSGGFGKEISVERLAEIFKELEEKGAHNINLVTPTHYSKEILEAFSVYKPKIPVVYNCSGYESIETLKKFKDIVDIYLTDIKYFDNDVSLKYSKAEDYFAVASEAVREMISQKPENIFDKNGIMQKGVIIRHLVLPLNLTQTRKIFEWVKNEFSEDVIISLMSQYIPMHKASEFKEINRKITAREYDKALSIIEELGFENVFIQELSSSKEAFIPPFNLEGV
ncbi:MAG: radical SAM protein [Clostridia bacterium]|nr:radical SAM protein [Clostridia bacterium]